MTIDNPRDWDAGLAELLDDNEPTGSAGLVDDPGQRGPVVRSTQRRALFAPWLRSWQAFTTTAKWAAGYAAHTTAYHLLRLPKYAGKLMLRSPRGLGRIIVGYTRWVFDWEAERLRQFTADTNDPHMYKQLADKRDYRHRGRLIASAFFAMLLLCGGLTAWLAMPPTTLRLTLAALGCLLIVVCGLFGGQPDKPLTDRAVVSTRVAKLTSDVVVRALGVLGLAGINQALAKDPRAIGFPAPITRDGPGWRADIDLPYGVTAGEVMERRDKLASGLTRPLGCVWPEGANHIHPGRLVLWVGDQDMAATRPPVSPLLKAPSFDVFKPLPFGTDPRGRAVSFDLMYTNVLIGSIPGMGKTFSLRVPLLAAALDPRAELWVYELKGTGDLEPLGHVATRYASGPDDDTVEEALIALRDLRKECARRAAQIKALPKTVCPENKVTAQLAGQKSLGLHPLVVAIDECQELFSHPTFGKEAGELAEKVIKLGRALGVILLLATQRPDAKSVPTGVSANVGTRLCLRVMGQMENDMILGTSSYRNGIRATMLTSRDKGVGYLVGAGDEATIVRSHYIDGVTADRLCLRARALREAAGTLAGYAAGQAQTATVKVTDTLLDDILTVVPVSEPKVWGEAVVTRLAALRPDLYGGWTPDRLTAALKGHRIQVGRQVWGTDPTTGKGANRKGIHRDDILAAVTERDRNRGAN